MLDSGMLFNLGGLWGSETCAKQSHVSCSVRPGHARAGDLPDSADIASEIQWKTRKTNLAHKFLKIHVNSCFIIY